MSAVEKQEDKYSSSQQAWDGLAARYRDGFNGLSIYEETYEEFCALCKGTQILELGCGPATITHRLLSIRPDYNILATDCSAAMLEETRKLVPQVEVRLMDARYMSELRTEFDGIVAGFVMPYLDQRDARQFLTDVGELLKPGGLFYLSYVPATRYAEKLQQSSDAAFSMLFHFYTDEQVANWSGMAGLRILKTYSVEYTNGRGEKEIHRVMILKKRG